MIPKKGYTLIELILVMFLLLFIALAVFSLTRVGSEAYLRLTTQQSLQSDLRIAASYLDVKLKQNDTAGAVMAASLSITDRDQDLQVEALKIVRTIEGLPYELWIFQYDGYLYELLKEPDSIAALNMSSRIVRADDLELVFDADDALRIMISRVDDQGIRYQRERTITLRAGGNR